MENIELKAKCTSLDNARKVCEAINAEFQWRRMQCDVYFTTGREERLKLRIEDNEPPCLVHYYRPTTQGSRGCRYSLLRLENNCHNDAKAFFTGALGSNCQVSKMRELFMWDGVRIHLDSVKGLGDFIEFEHPIGLHDPLEATERVNWLTLQFGIAPEEVVAGSYSDMPIGRVENPR